MDSDAPELAEMPGGLLTAYQWLVRRAFHHFYREFAWTYDAVAWVVSGGLWRRWVLAPLPLLVGRTLELGFGPGHLQRALAARPGSAGLDASPQMAALAARRLRRAGHRPRLARGYAQALPFAGAAFDTVVATFPAEYILEPQTQAEVRRVLAPGGRLVLVPVAQLDPGLYARFIDLVFLLSLQPLARRGGQPAPAPAPLSFAGFALEPRWIAVGASRVLVLVGGRAGAEPGP